jgi:thioredoxin 1
MVILKKVKEEFIMSNSNVIKITKDIFEEEVLKSDVPVLVDFWAPWCGPCKMIAPVLDELSIDVGETAKICKVNVDEQGEIASEYRILSIPTLILFNKGEIVDKIIGARSKEDLRDFIEKAK